MTQYGEWRTTNFVYQIILLKTIEITTMWSIRVPSWFFGTRLKGGQHRNLGWAKWFLGREDGRTGQSLQKPHRFWDVLFFMSYKLTLSHFMSSQQGCYYPPVIDHGRPKLTSHTFTPNEAKYECDKGYILVGNPTITCSYSRWSGPPPQCKGNSSPWLSGRNCYAGIENNVSFQPVAEQKHDLFILNNYYIQMVPEASKSTRGIQNH